KSVTGAVTWSSSNASVATISTSGMATAVADGSVQVTATVGGVTGSATLTVSTSQSQACTQPTTVSLAVGEYQAFPSTDCLILPSGSNGDRYRVAVLDTMGTTADAANPTTDTTTATLKVTGLGVAAAPAAQVVAPAMQAPIPGLDVQALLKAVRSEKAAEEIEARRLTRDAALMAGMPRSAVLPARQAIAPSLAPAATTLPNTLRFDTVTSTCTARTPAATDSATANLLYQNADMAIYQDSVQETTTPVSAADAKLMADYYSSYAKAMITSYFGANPDIDNNGKLIVLVSPVASGNTAAFVWTGDLVSQSACPSSNERDMIYFNADLIRQIDSSPQNWQALPTVAHEAKHVVSLYDRLVNGTFHPTWVEEGTAEISGEMSSRIAWAANGGPAVGAQVTYSDFQSSGVNEYDYGVLLRLARTVFYLSSQPNGLIVAPTGADPNESIYGSGWHFFRWLGDGYGNASTPMADSSFFRQQTDSLTPAGTAGLQSITGQSFPTLVKQFIAAISLDGSSAPAPQHAFSTYDFVTATNILATGTQPDGQYPWPVTTSNGVLTKSFATATYAGPIGAWGIRIHDFVSNGTGTGAQIQTFLSSPGTVVVVRLN
ncbi:MAG: Ig-like domain-containing protein, partial [Gemmatimonadetes bacterium]|nr:Ig-like domain-containing protein [Gemmatimonadota bacterium]